MSNCNNYTTTGTQACACQQEEQTGACGARPPQNACGCTQQTAADAAGTQTDETNNCACRDSLATALRLLCSGDLAGLVDFNRFAFIGKNFLIGTYRTCPCGETGVYDNLADTLTGSFNRFTPCSCDLIDISGTVYGDTPLANPDLVSTLFTTLSENLDGTTGTEGVVTALAALADRLNPTSANFRADLQAAFLPLLGGCACPQVTVDEVSLCALGAIAFDAAGSGTVQEANYQALKQILLQILRPKCPPPCPPCTPPKPQPCRVPCGCKNTGILASLDRCGMVQALSLTAGPLLLKDVTLLGAIGSALILANDSARRIYYVCAEDVEFLG